ncbi:MAG: LON peptidase substrate-binding domain-containing protein [Thermonemataceae bacterium]
MKKEIPLFPLNLVVYPFEKLNLHIFEPRYKQLVRECLDHNRTFGIPAFINNKIEMYGTEMKINKVERVYEDDRMDIRTEGVDLFHIADFQNPLRDKLYAGGMVETFNWDDDAVDQMITQQLMSRVKELYKLLNLHLAEDTFEQTYLSYTMGHKIGLSLEQELALLKIKTEEARQQYLINHLDKAIPVVADMERTKERIRMNGHFKNLDPLNF